jgi:hypothetical protein
MDWLWNWGGECFGYREGESLFTYFGKEIGRFDGEEIFGNNGRYGRGHERPPDHEAVQEKLGEGSFGPRRSGSYARYANYAGYAMYAGYEDFPRPGSFR